MNSFVKSIVDSYEEQLKSIRHHLHEHPELSFEEYQTAAYIRESLSKMGVAIADGFSGTSTVGVLKGSEPGPCIAFRADIDVSTCGRISPLNALNYLIDNFDSDIVTLDYHVRGFTRDLSGKKLFIDHRINSIQNYISQSTRSRYNMIDVNVYQENIFHTKMMLKDFDLNNYLFNMTADQLTERQRNQIRKLVYQEMLEIFNGHNMPTMR